MYRRGWLLDGMKNSIRSFQACIITSPHGVASIELLRLIADISEDRSSLINVVKALGEYLTSEDSALLQKGV